MLPFPQLVYYGNNIIPEIKLIKQFNVTYNSAQTILYDNGDLYALGFNGSSNSLFGTGNTTAITGAWSRVNTNVRLCASSNVSTVIIKKDGTAWYSGNITNAFANSSGQGYGLTNTSTWTDMTSVFSTFDIAGIKGIYLYENSPSRFYLIDVNNQLWGIGSNQYNALGNSTSTNSLYTLTQIPNGDNVSSVYFGQNVTWIKKLDGTYWRAGTNTYGTLADSTTTSVRSTFQQYTISGTIGIQKLSVNDYNLWILGTDGAVRIYGNNGQYQAGNGSTSPSTYVASPYIPVTSGANNIISSSGYYYSTFIGTSAGLKAVGLNNSYLLGTGIASNPTTAITNASTGAMSRIDTTDIRYLCNNPSNAYAVVNDEVYVTGSTNYSLLSATATTWTLMSTPQSVLWTSEAPIAGVYSNISTTVPNMARYGHAVCPYGTDKFIVYGGALVSGNTMQSDIWIYDSPSDTWTQVPVDASAIAKYGACITVYNGKLYIFGGRITSTGGSTTNTMHSVDLSTGVFTLLSTTGTPGARDFAKMCSIGASIYIFGGTGFSTSNNFYRFDPGSSVYTIISNVPSDIGTQDVNTDMVSDGTDLYVCTTNTTFYKYVVSKNIWVLLSAKGSGTARMVYCNGFIYLLSTSGAQIRAYRIASNLWSTVGSGTTMGDRFVLGASTNQGKVYWIGGSSSSASTNTWKIV